MDVLEKKQIEQPTMTTSKICDEVDKEICGNCIVSMVCKVGCDEFKEKFNEIFMRREEELKKKFPSSS